MNSQDKKKSHKFEITFFLLFVSLLCGLVLIILHFEKNSNQQLNDKLLVRYPKQSIQIIAPRNGSVDEKNSLSQSFVKLLILQNTTIVENISTIHLSNASSVGTKTKLVLKSEENKGYEEHKISAEKDEKRPEHVTMERFNKSLIPKISWFVDTEHPRGNLCIPKWNHQIDSLAHMHIGKAGGTTLDKCLKESIRKSKYTLKQEIITSLQMFKDRLTAKENRLRLFFMERHNDMHFINEYKKQYLLNSTRSTRRKEEERVPLRVLSFIRNPVERETSQFYFSKKIKVLRKDYKFEDWIYKMVDHPETIKGTSALFADGSSAVMWFSGTINEEWVNKGLTAKDRSPKADIILNHQIDMMKTAVENYHEHFLWVGLLDQSIRSYRLLEYQLGITLHNQEKVMNPTEYPDPTEVEKLVLATANPMDMALYTYIREIQLAKLKLFEEATRSHRPVRECSDKILDNYSFPFFFNGTQIW